MPGPDSSSPSDATPPSAVPLKRVMMSPALRPASSAGPPGVTASMRAPSLSLVASAFVLTTTPMRPRLPANVYPPNGPVSTRVRTRERVLARARGAGSCATATDERVIAASAATIQLRFMVGLSGPSQAHVASSADAHVHQLAHQVHPLFPELYEFGVLRLRLERAPPRQVAIDDGNPVLQLRHLRCHAPGQHPAIDVIVLELVFERGGLILGHGKLGVQRTGAAQSRSEEHT